MKARAFVLSMIFVILSAISASAQSPDQDNKKSIDINDHDNHTIFTTLRVATILAVGNHSGNDVWAPNVKVYFIHPAKWVWIGGVSIGLATGGIGPFLAIVPLHIGPVSFSFTPYSVTGKHGNGGRLVTFDVDLWPF